APLVRFDFLLCSIAFSIAFTSKPLCFTKFWSSLQITANCKFFEMLSIETQSCFQVISLLSCHCSKLLITISGVIGMGIHLKSNTINSENKNSQRISFPINLKKFFIISIYELCQFFSYATANGNTHSTKSYTTKHMIAYGFYNSLFLITNAHNTTPSMVYFKRCFW